MSMKLIINKLFSDESIKKIEETHNAKYVLDTCLSNSDQNSDILCAVFYSEEKHPEGSHFFALYFKRDFVGDKPRLMITNGAFILDQKIRGILAKNEDVIYSKHRHDFVTSPDGSISVDGGQQYQRVLFKEKMPEAIHIDVSEDGVVSLRRREH